MTKAIILAAGQGTRLRPITNDRPKCLVPLVGKSLLKRQVETLNLESIFDIHIVTGYKAEQITALGYDTSFNENFHKTNMVESLFTAMDFLKDCNEDLIIAYGDIIYQQENLKALLACNDEISLMIDKNWRELWSLRLEDPLDDAETLVMDDNGYVIELGKKPESYDKIQGQYTGLIKISSKKIKSVIDFYESLSRTETYDGKDFKNMYMTTFIQLMINSGWKVKASIVSNGWLEIDSVEDLQCYEHLFHIGKLNKIITLSI